MITWLLQELNICVRIVDEKFQDQKVKEDLCREDVQERKTVDHIPG